MFGRFVYYQQAAYAVHLTRTGKDQYFASGDDLVLSKHVPVVFWGPHHAAAAMLLSLKSCLDRQMIKVR